MVDLVELVGFGIELVELAELAELGLCVFFPESARLFFRHEMPLIVLLVIPRCPKRLGKSKSVRISKKSWLLSRLLKSAQNSNNSEKIIWRLSDCRETTGIAHQNPNDILVIILDGMSRLQAYSGDYPGWDVTTPSFLRT